MLFIFIYPEFLTEDTTGLVAESHVADLAAQLQGSVEVLNHGVQAVGNQSNLLVEGSIGDEVGHGNGSESSKLRLEAGVPLEQAGNERIVR